MAAPTIYRSDDASAPVLSYGAGTLIAVLDACLVNGYGAKGAAGWAKTYSGTNKAAYKMGTGGTARRMFLRVDDAQLQYGMIRGFDDMTDVDTGTEPFPTVAQFAGPVSNGGMFFNKSSVASGSTARPWVLIATPTCFYFQAWTSQASASSFPSFDPNGHGMFFGEYVSYLGGGFTHHVAIIGNGMNSQLTGSMLGVVAFPTNNLQLACHYVCRAHTGGAGSTTFTKTSTVATAHASSGSNPMGRPGGTSFAYPEPVSGKLFGSRVLVVHSGGARAGRMPGLWNPFATAGNMFDTIDGSGGAAGRTLLALDLTAGSYLGDGGSNNLAGRGFFDITDLD